jgi:5'-phosphate synthase pdxT subunit
MPNSSKIGILAIQGDYDAHAQVLDRLHAEHTFVRRLEDLAGVEGVILPGGESTTHLKVMREEGLFDALKTFAKNGGAFFGTCAGAILLAKEVHGPPQLASDVHAAATKLSKNPLEMVFIRAPIIESVGNNVEVLAEDAGHPVLVREGKVLASTFHPELTNDSTVHEYFLKLIGNGRNGS